MLLEGKGGSGGGRVVGSGGESGVGGKREKGGGGYLRAELQTVSPALALVREPLTITCSTRTDASASWRAHATLEQEPKRSETAAVQHQAPEDDLDQSTKKTRKTKKLKPNCVCVLNKPLEEPTEDL